MHHDLFFRYWKKPNQKCLCQTQTKGEITYSTLYLKMLVHTTFINVDTHIEKFIYIFRLAGGKAEVFITVLAIHILHFPRISDKVISSKLVA